MTELMRVTRDCVLRQPNVRGLWRATVITTGLARLAERGFPPDAFMRTCMAEVLTARVIATVEAMWLAVVHGDIPRGDVAYLEEWLSRLDGLIGIQELENPRPEDVRTACHREGFDQFVRQWVSETSITHLLGWRCDEPLRVAPEPADLLIGESRRATVWVFERFTETYLDRWSDESINWELAFNDAPDQVARRVGLDQAVLAERTVLSSDLLRENARRVMMPSRAPDQAVVESVLTLLEAGDLNLGRNLAERLESAHPDERQLQQLRWFSCVISQPRRAREAFVRLASRSADPVLVANTVACFLVEGDLEGARLAAAALDDHGSVQRAWLWWPSSLADDARVEFTSLGAWLSDLQEVLSREQFSGLLDGKDEVEILHG